MSEKMSEHFNGLTPAEAERLAILAEECGEVMQAIGKVLRHGYEDYSPYDVTHTTNRVKLENECGDLAGILHIMAVRGDVRPAAVEAMREAKIAKLPRWTHHQPDSLALVSEPSQS